MRKLVLAIFNGIGSLKCGSKLEKKIVLEEFIKFLILKNGKE